MKLHPLNPGLLSNSILFRVKERHTGEHLASLAADCIKRFGLEDKVRQIVNGPLTRIDIFMEVTCCLHGQRWELQYNGRAPIKANPWFPWCWVSDSVFPPHG